MRVTKLMPPRLLAASLLAVLSCSGGSSGIPGRYGDVEFISGTQDQFNDLGYPSSQPLAVGSSFSLQGTGFELDSTNKDVLAQSGSQFTAIGSGRSLIYAKRSQYSVTQDRPVLIPRLIDDVIPIGLVDYISVYTARPGRLSLCAAECDQRGVSLLDDDFGEPTVSLSAKVFSDDDRALQLGNENVLCNDRAVEISQSGDEFVGLISVDRTNPFIRCSILDLEADLEIDLVDPAGLSFELTPRIKQSGAWPQEESDLPPRQFDVRLDASLNTRYPLDGVTYRWRVAGEADIYCDGRTFEPGDYIRPCHDSSRCEFSTFGGTLAQIEAELGGTELVATWKESR